MKSYKFKITGRVQGVFYRASVQKSASENLFSGYVKNMKDKSVEACVTCDDSRIDEFMDILKKGSSGSLVDEIKVQECDEVFEDGFSIRY